MGAHLGRWIAIGAAVMAGATGAIDASAGTLYTTSAHTTTVAVGATLSATVTAPGRWLTSGTAAINVCTTVSLHLSVVQNSTGTVQASATSGAFNTCALSTTFTGPWTFGVSGFGTSAGAATQWNASLADVVFDIFGGRYTAGSLS